MSEDKNSIMSKLADKIDGSHAAIIMGLIVMAGVIPFVDKSNQEIYLRFLYVGGWVLGILSVGIIIRAWIDAWDRKTCITCNPPEKGD